MHLSTETPEQNTTSETSMKQDNADLVEEIRSTYFKDPASFISHFIGFIVAIIGFIALLMASPGPTTKTATFVIYGISAMLLFLASSAYHFFNFSDASNLWLRRLDHSAIFIMIIGTYIPMVVHLLDGGWRLGMLIALGILGVVGITFKLTWFHAPRWITVAMYLGLGWLAVIPGPKLLETIPTDTLIWLLIGGGCYSLGAVVYAVKWPNISEKYFDFHDAWHIFVLGGAVAHYVMVWTLLSIPVP